LVLPLVNHPVRLDAQEKGALGGRESRGLGVVDELLGKLEMMSYGVQLQQPVVEGAICGKG
jgi:hypothetical protein